MLVTERREFGRIKEFLGALHAGGAHAALDRVLEQQRWTCGKALDSSGARCLIGVTEDVRSFRAFHDRRSHDALAIDIECKHMNENDGRVVFDDFDDLFPVYGEELITAIKAEAARLIGQPVLPAPVAEEVTV